MYSRTYTFSQLQGSIWGFVVGDALGVPVEFEPRVVLKSFPVKHMRGYGTHKQPQGTWSDDSSLLFCTMESLCQGYNLQDMAKKFIEWYRNGLWTPYGQVFDVGNTTRNGILNLEKGNLVHEATLNDERSIGNGSLMRILPIVFWVSKMSINERFEIIKQVSSLTHAHLRSVLACFIYVEFMWQLIENKTLRKAYENTQLLVNDFCDRQYFLKAEAKHFHRILQEDISKYKESEISSTGYVVHTLEAALWSFFTGNNYEEVTTLAVNLGDDTDTTGAIAGSMAGLYYGLDSIPEDWRDVIARKMDILFLIEKFYHALNK
ncbi:MAG: ADP-ribosylglycohydrolase family protein [Microscillaceae bacterium]|nr:ADP-ribosylglycohydrolase family protein [Microscillaceae bacterium]MDW8460093.1 ADP-ribosylglycohydrolase family protein [Cytophagales bacterium]